MRTFRSFAIMAVACVLLAGTGWAGVITQTQTVVLHETDWGPTALTFAQFDILGGARTLNSVYVQILGEVEGLTRIENLGGSSGIFTSHLSANVELANPDGSSYLVDSLPTINSSDSLSAYDGITDWAGTDSATHTGTYWDTTACLHHYCYTTLHPGDTYFSSFLGTSTISLNASAAGTSGAGGGGGLNFHSETNAAAVAEVIYNYTSNGGVPEPGTMSLLGSALIGLGLIGRKHFQR